MAMIDLNSVTDLPLKLALVLLYGSIIYAAAVTFDRLVLSPLAAFPGPKLAALTNWYEFYYDVIQQGQFTFKIQELHKKYGMYMSHPSVPRAASGINMLVAGCQICW